MTAFRNLRTRVIPSRTARATVTTVAMSAAMSLSLAACDRAGAREAAAATTAASAPATVGPENLAIVAHGHVQSGPLLSGTLVPTEQAAVRAMVSGPVVAVHADVGVRVRRAAPLVDFDDRTLRDALLSARSAVRSAEAAVENARREYERQKQLFAIEAVAQKGLEGARSTLASDEAALADARARWSSARQQLAYAHVVAPIDGIVSARAVSVGDVVSVGGEVFTVVDPRSLQLQASVPADALDAVRVDLPVAFTVRGYPGRTFAGRIARVSPAADPATRNVDVYATIPNTGTLVTGLFASGRVVSEARQGLVAPVAVLDARDVRPTVVRLRGGRVERVSVRVGLRDETAGQIQITNGVTEGDTLLTGAAQQLRAGTRAAVSRINAPRTDTARVDPTHPDTPRAP